MSSAFISTKMPQAKNIRIRYLRLRSGQSSHRGNIRFLPKSFCPPFQRYSDKNPTGQTHEQKLFFISHASANIRIKSTRPAGWMVLKSPVRTQYFRLIRELIGRNASTPGGLATSFPLPSRKCTNCTNRQPVKRVIAKKNN